MAAFGMTFTDLYSCASNAAQQAFNKITLASKNAMAGFERTRSAAARAVQQAEDYGVKQWDEGVQSIRHQVATAKRAADSVLSPHPAGDRIQRCPRNLKAERVKDRKIKIHRSHEKLSLMPAGKQRDVLAHATERFERNNVAVERARLANDAYNVGQGDPPDGWERVTRDELLKMGMDSSLFPQLSEGFDSKEYKDGYYPELYKMKSDVFGEERYVLAFRGTQGIKDGEADFLQAFGEETDQYTNAIKTAQKLKEIFGEKLDITGHSMGGGMATAAGIVTGSPVYAIDPAGVHPATVERVGKEYTRKLGDRYVKNFVAEGEILDSVQRSVIQREVVGGIGMVSPQSALLLAGAGHRAMTEQGTVIYGAAGPVYQTPILGNAKKVLDGTTDQGMSPGLGGRLNNSLNPIQKVALHNPEYVIAGMEQQKTDDLNVMTRSIDL